MKEDPSNSSDSTLSISVSGRRFDAEEIALVRDLSKRFPGLSRNELALTVCELLDWCRPSGKPKGRECLDLFDSIEGLGICRFPAAKKQTRRRGAPRRTPVASEPLAFSPPSLLHSSIRMSRGRLRLAS